MFSGNQYQYQQNPQQYLEMKSMESKTKSKTKKGGKKTKKGGTKLKRGGICVTQNGAVKSMIEFFNDRFASGINQVLKKKMSASQIASDAETGCWFKLPTGLQNYVRYTMQQQFYALIDTQIMPLIRTSIAQQLASWTHVSDQTVTGDLLPQKAMVNQNANQNANQIANPNPNNVNNDPLLRPQPVFPALTGGSFYFYPSGGHYPIKNTRRIKTQTVAAKNSRLNSKLNHHPMFNTFNHKSQF